MPETDEFKYIMNIGTKKGVVRTPQFPGVLKSFPGNETGKMIEAVRSFIKKQKRARGFQFGISTGVNKNTIELSGTARIFLGFSIFFSPDEDFGTLPDKVTFTINNEIVIQDVNPNFFTPDFMDDEYYSFPRPLSGTDTIELETEGNADVDLFLIVYYI